MTDARRVLLAGESWIMHTIHQKGFDSFTTTEYGEGHQYLSAALTAGGWHVEHLPNHLAPTRFPSTMEDLGRYDVVILSDIGANTLLLPPDTFARSIPTPNRLELLHDWVAGGGALVMVGGYLTFTGIDAKGHWAGTPVEEVLPVTMMPTDDRVEMPQGVRPALLDADHRIAAGLPERWPPLLGWNRLAAKPDATVVATIREDPLLTVWTYGRGRSAAFASDCGPHWVPPEFCNWEGYALLWQSVLTWLTGPTQP